VAHYQTALARSDIDPGDLQLKLMLFGDINHLPIDIIGYILPQMPNDLPTEAMRGRPQFRFQA
jgi:hypothetical protein